MVECPVCGVTSPPEQAACEVCGLPANLFEEFKDVASPLANSEPDPETQGSERAPEALRPKPSLQDPPVSSPISFGGVREVGRPALFGASPPLETPSDPHEARAADSSLRMGAAEIEGARQRFTSRATTAQLSRRRRELITSVLDALIDRYRRLCDRRDVFSPVIRTQSLDAELAAYRRALSSGEIKPAEEHRRKAHRMIESVEASWVRISAQITEANRMIRALRELGGVAPTVLRPVAAAVKVPRRAEAAQIERRLKQANGLLWKLLVPRLEHELSMGRSVLAKTEAPTVRTEPIRLELDRLTEKIRLRNIGEALESHRFLRAGLAALGPRAPRRSPAHFSIDQIHHS
jgi:hypothetical protein